MRLSLWSIRLGVALIVTAVLWLGSAMLGIVSTELTSFAGDSGLRSIAAIAVIGCVLGALGCWKEEQEKLR
jgi:hypothetical protein